MEREHHPGLGKTGPSGDQGPGLCRRSTPVSASPAYPLTACRHCVRWGSGGGRRRTTGTDLGSFLRLRWQGQQPEHPDRQDHQTETHQRGVPAVSERRHAAIVGNGRCGDHGPPDIIQAAAGAIGPWWAGAAMGMALPCFTSLQSSRDDASPACAAWRWKVSRAQSRHLPQDVATDNSSCSASKLAQPSCAARAMSRSEIRWQMQTIMHLL